MALRSCTAPDPLQHQEPLLGSGVLVLQGGKGRIRLRRDLRGRGDCGSDRVGLPLLPDFFEGMKERLFARTALRERCLKTRKARGFCLQYGRLVFLFADLPGGAVRAQPVNLSSQLLDRPVVGRKIILLRRDVADLGLDHRRGLCLMTLLGPEYGSHKGVPVDSEQLLADRFGKIGAGQSRLLVKQVEGVLFLFGAKDPQHAVGPIPFLKRHTAAVHAAAPGPVAQALVSVLVSLHLSVKSVKHHFQKDGKGRFAPAVFRKNDIQWILEHIREIGQPAEMLDM